MFPIAENYLSLLLILLIEIYLVIWYYIII